ncbi:hypothetical protein CLV84_2312 [Neolewinella xylanilytica]|uniref:DUF937 domain-containing protein n=1 Tax=Neolewinella xylanilytica TaxID=1514080 RepID=A0A2S6I2M5_9BACT|nr:hypothetical protein [Neolewinella xylanilytica]PPK85415.1 hypothetical protein CLV84_2312 [Neolewinella xylanilytica]
MLESIVNSVKSEIISNLKEKTGLGPQEAEKTVPLAKDSITQGMTSALSSGNIGGILEMIKGAGGSATEGGTLQNSVFQGIAETFVHKLTGQLGLSEGVSQKVAGIVLPMILSKLAGKTRAAGQSDDIDKGSLLDVLGLDASDLLGGLLGGKGKSGGAGGLGDSLGSLFK